MNSDFPVWTDNLSGERSFRGFSSPPLIKLVDENRGFYRVIFQIVCKALGNGDSEWSGRVAGKRRAMEEADTFKGTCSSLLLYVLPLRASCALAAEGMGSLSVRRIRSVSGGVRALTEGVGALTEGVRSLSEGVRSLSYDRSWLSERVRALTEGVGAMTEGVRSLSHDRSWLSERVRAPRRGVCTLTKRVRALSGGVRALTEGSAR
jgi:hypothetical protein